MLQEELKDQNSKEDSVKTCTAAVQTTPTADPAPFETKSSKIDDPVGEMTPPTPSIRTIYNKEPAKLLPEEDSSSSSSSSEDPV